METEGCTLDDTKTSEDWLWMENKGPGGLFWEKPRSLGTGSHSSGSSHGSDD